MNYFKFTSPCGLDCFNCPMYLANENEELRAKISKNSGIPFNQALCKGCRDEQGAPDFLNWTEPCNVYKCITKRNLDFCCFCEDYPCKELNEFMNDKWPHHWTMEHNLAFIRDHGVEKWLKTQKQEWSCKSCGAEIMWYQKKCSCGKQLEAWPVPA